MRGFWNDPDGISMSDCLALAFTAVYVALIGITVNKLLRGTIIAEDIQFLQVVTWPVLTILGGYFGGQMLGQLKERGARPSAPRASSAYGGFPGDGGVAPAVIDPRLPVLSLGPAAHPVETADEVEEGYAHGPR